MPGLERFGGKQGKTIQAQVLAGHIAAGLEDRQDAADALYYAAKSRVYRESTYMEDMQRIHRNISAMRSLAILSLGLIPIWLFVACRELVNGLRRKFLRHALLALLILLATHIASRWCLGLEEMDFNKRGYGYFASLLTSP